MPHFRLVVRAETVLALQSLHVVTRLPIISFVWTWMRLKSGSLWPGVVLHAAHNTFFQQFFDPLTVDNSKTRYVAGEFGAALLVVSILMAIYFWRRRDEVMVAARPT